MVCSRLPRARHSLQSLSAFLLLLLAPLLIAVRSAWSDGIAPNAPMQFIPVTFNASALTVTEGVLAVGQIVSNTKNLFENFVAQHPELTKRGAVDGDFGTQSVQALKKFQTDIGRTPDGTLTQELVDRLLDTIGGFSAFVPAIKKGFIDTRSSQSPADGMQPLPPEGPAITALPQKIILFVSGAGLQSACSANASGNAACVAYVQGVVDAFVTMAFHQDEPRGFCLPAGETGPQLAEMVADYVIGHPELQQVGGPGVIQQMLDEKLPCKPQ
jgi:peptidoglycan hydrolase-like protein with peptidoglycan-binding domain